MGVKRAASSDTAECGKLQPESRAPASTLSRAGRPSNRELTEKNLSFNVAICKQMERLSHREPPWDRVLPIKKKSSIQQSDLIAEEDAFHLFSYVEFDLDHWITGQSFLSQNLVRVTFKVAMLQIELEK